MNPSADEHSKYRVLMIAPTPFFADRGCHIRIYEEARVLEKLGNEVIICTYHNGRDIGGIKIRRISSIPWYKKLDAGPSYHKFYIDFLLLLKSIRVAYKFKPDIIHAHLHEGIIIGKCISRLFNIPVVFDYQGSLSEELTAHTFVKKGTLKYRIVRYIEEKVNPIADFIFANSSKSREILITKFNVRHDKIITIHDGVDTERFTPEYDVRLLRERLKIPDSKIVVYLGLLTEYQGIDILMEAIKEVTSKRNDVHFLIMGYPDEKKYYKMAKDLGVERHTTFTGRIAYEDAPRYLCLGDIAVSPKISQTEANGKVLDYMACGLRTVVFDTDINTEILGDLGIYARFGDKESLAERIIEALESNSSPGGMLRKMAIENYSWEDTCHRIVNLYDKLLKSKKVGVLQRNG